MIKRMSAYWLPEGTDEDKFWKYHTEIHAADVVRNAGPALKKYTISRVVKCTKGEKPNVFAFIEMWWESEEAMNEALETMGAVTLQNGKKLGGDFWGRVAGGYIVITDEFVAKDIGLTP
jgi:uncharacterized protein (TIGR02118 family)